jgi:hypothetical protein
MRRRWESLSVEDYKTAPGMAGLPLLRPEEQV